MSNASQGITHSRVYNFMIQTLLRTSNKKQRKKMTVSTNVKLCFFQQHTLDKYSINVELTNHDNYI